MALHFSTTRNRFGQYTPCGVAAFLLWSMCLQSGKAQQAAPSASAGAKQLSADPPLANPVANPLTTQSVPSQPLPTAFSLFGDSQKAIRKGLLFYATGPLSERELERLGVASTPFSVTVPLETDQTNHRLFVSSRIDSHPVRLYLDTGGGPGVVLTKVAAQGIKLYRQFPSLLSGEQGSETVTEGLAHSMTLGNLTLRAIDTVVRAKQNTIPYCTLGTQVLEHYRITLDLLGKTMTLSRGGMPVAVPNDITSLSVPFRNDKGYLFVPVRVLNQSVWAYLDSGSDANVLSLSMARLAAAQLDPSDSVSHIFGQKIGTGDTHRSFTLMGFVIPVPISLDTGQDDSRHSHPSNDRSEFSTTSQFGMSTIEDELDQYFSVPIGVQLGLPFFLQFRRVIIDYPNHVLILQQPQHSAPVNFFSRTPGPGKFWPGYQWRRVGDGWVEVPDKNVQDKGTQGSPLSASALSPTTVTGTTISQSDHGAITVVDHGIKTVYPPGSTIKVDKNGSIHVTVPPGVANPSDQLGRPGS